MPRLGQKYAVAKWIGVLVLLIALALWMERTFLRIQLDGYKAHLTAQGESLDLSILHPPLIDDSSNGFLVVIDAVKMLPDLPDSETGIPSVPSMARTSPGVARVTWKEETLRTFDRRGVNVITNLWAELPPLIEPNRHLIHRLQDGCAMPEFQFARKVSENWRVYLNKGRGIRRVPRWLQSVAAYEMRNGALESAARCQLSLVRFIHQLKSAPDVILLFTRNTTIHPAFALQWELLQYLEWPNSTLKQWQEEWSRIAFYEDLPGVIRRERAWSSDQLVKARRDASVHAELIGLPAGSYWDLINNDPEAALRLAGYRFVWPAWISYADERRHLELAQSALDLTRRLIDSQSLLAVQKEMITMTNAWSIPAMFVVSRQTICAYLNSLVEKACESDNRVSLAVAAIALERWRNRYGNYPESLAQLVPEFLKEPPRDHVDGKTIRYQRTDSYFKLWSIGLNGVDEGGDDTPIGSKPANYYRRKDLVWPRPASASEVAAYMAGSAWNRP
jgi:hypothetical protein